MTVPVWINQEGNYIDVDLGTEFQGETNFVASAYGRNIKSPLEYANENDGFLYQSEDIEKVRQLIARNGLQLPTPLKLSDSNITIPQSDTDVNNIISNSGGNDSSVLQSNANNDTMGVVNSDSSESGEMSGFTEADPKEYYREPSVEERVGAFYTGRKKSKQRQVEAVAEKFGMNKEKREPSPCLPEMYIIFLLILRGQRMVEQYCMPQMGK